MSLFFMIAESGVQYISTLVAMHQDQIKSLRGGKQSDRFQELIVSVHVLYD